MKLASFFIDLLVDAGSGQLTVGRLIQSMGQLEVVSIANVGALYTLAQRIISLNDTQVKASMGLDLLAHKTDISSVEMQKWKVSMRLANVEGSTFEGVIQSLTGNIEALKFTGQSPLVALSQYFDIVGLEGMKSIEILDAIANSEIFKNAGPGENAFRLSAGGINPDILPWLSKTKKERAELRKEGERTPGLSKEEIDKYKAIYVVSEKIQFSAKNIGEDIANWSAEGILKGLREVEKILAGAVEAVEYLTTHEDKRLKDLKEGPKGGLSMEFIATFLSQTAMINKGGISSGAITTANFGSSAFNAASKEILLGIRNLPTIKQLSDFINKINKNFQVNVGVNIDGKYIPSTSEARILEVSGRTGEDAAFLIGRDPE